MFTLFPKLPVELRIQIWKDARERRIVEVHWASETGYKPHMHPPTLLSVCKESREVISPVHFNSELYLGDPSVRFDPECDILYFPYPSECAVSYGLSLRSFLQKMVPDTGIRHLALCIPLLNPELEANIEALERHSGFNPAEAKGRNSTTFFSTMYVLARRMRNLNLETLTIVMNDSYMKKQSDDSPREPDSVTRGFKEMLIGDENGKKLWAARAEFFQREVTRAHEPWYEPDDNGVAHYYKRTWGTPRVKIRTVERNYLHSSLKWWDGRMLPSMKLNPQEGSQRKELDIICDYESEDDEDADADVVNEDQ